MASRQRQAVIDAHGTVRHVGVTLDDVVYLVFFADLVSPELGILRPPDGSWLATNAPDLQLAYTDAASGIDAASLRVVVDGQDVTATCAPVEGGSACVLAGVLTLSEGAHVLHAEVADRMGNRAEASASFTVDTLPPATPDDGLIAVEPTADPELWQLTGAPGAVEPGGTVLVRNTRTGETVSVTAGPDGSFSVSIRAEQGDALEVRADRAGN